jgi:2,3-dihydroxy-p-cumate/2,3-dihydroxybenzoate 3,4-dioxygenase
MIELKDIAYVRAGTQDLEQADQFARHIIGLQRSAGAGKVNLYRSDQREQTLTYVEGSKQLQVVGFEVASKSELEAAAAILEDLGHAVVDGSAAGCEERRVQAFIGFRDPSGNAIEFCLRPATAETPYQQERAANITGFNHVGLYSTDVVRDELFWTRVCNARVSDRIGAVPLLRINDIHHTIALAPADHAGIHHVNHQVSSTDDIFRAFHLLQRHRVPIVFGPGRHPTSGARFLYFRSPDGLVFEYSVGVDRVNEATHRPRCFALDRWGLCTWGATWNSQTSSYYS